MKNKEDLKKELIKIDHKSYGMYKTLGGSYSYGNYILHMFYPSTMYREIPLLLLPDFVLK